MNLKAVHCILVLFSAFLLCAVFSYAENFPSGNALAPGIITCGHIDSSSSSTYNLEIGQNVSVASFGLGWENAGSKFELMLNSPSCKKIEPVFHTTSPESTETLRSYSIQRPEVGIWGVEVSAISVPKDGENYCISVNLKNGTVDDAAKLNGIYRDYSTDINHDGFAEYVTIAVGINVKVAGNYSLIGSIHDAGNSGAIPVSDKRYLNFGAHFMELVLYDIRSPGPYSLEKLLLYDDNGTKIDSSRVQYTTKVYKNLMSMRQSAKLIGNYSDYGLDVDGNGKYNYLTVDVCVEILKSGNYSLFGSLFNENATEVAWSIGYGNFSPGAHIMHMDFEGNAIETCKSNGPYYLKNLLLYKGNSFRENLSLEDACIDAYVTESYTYKQFENMAK